MEMLTVPVALILCLTTIHATIVNHRDCSDGTKNSVINLQVDVSDCDDVNYCALARGKNYTVTTSFTSLVDIDGLKFQPWALLGPIAIRFGKPETACVVPWPSDNKSNCKEPSGLVSGHRYTHVYKIPISLAYPTIGIPVRIVFQKKGRIIVCYEIPIHVVNP